MSKVTCNYSPKWRQKISIWAPKVETTSKVAIIPQKGVEELTIIPQSGDD